MQSIKIPVAFFTETEKNNPKITWNHKRVQIASLILRNKKQLETWHLLILKYIAGTGGQECTSEKSLPSLCEALGSISTTTKQTVNCKNCITVLL
jgi:hypothetical protein